MTTKTSLTERYIQEVARRLPEEQRADIAAELRGTIADTIDGRIAGGDVDEAAAERAVLQELGDPALLAMKYRDRPLYLIGPELFPAYWALLRRLIPLVPLVIGGIVLAAGLLSGEPAELATGDAVTAVIQVLFQVLFWVTLVFAVIERRSNKVPDEIAGPWTPDKLPDHARAARTGLCELVGGLIGVGLIAAFLVWQRNDSALLNSAGESVPLFHPDLWNGWIIAIYAALAAFVAVEVAKYLKGYWTYELAWCNALANAFFVAVLAGLTFADKLINPAFIETIDTEIGNEGVTAIVDWAATNFWLLVAIPVIIDITQAFLKAREGSIARS